MTVRDLVAALAQLDQDAPCYVHGTAWWNDGADISVAEDGRVFVAGGGTMLAGEPPTHFVRQEFLGSEAGAKTGRGGLGDTARELRGALEDTPRPESAAVT